MPKNNNDSGISIARSKARSKSTARKPLRDVSNAVKASSKSTATKKLDEQQRQQLQVGDDNGGVLDRLLLIHSDISSLIHQIDELVAQALKFTSKKGIMEVESFVDVLSEMHTSLKPWVPRFQKVLSNQSTGPFNQLEQSLASTEEASMNKDMSDVDESPEQTKWDSLISPSPLVSWRAGCTTEGGRQLFLLTPLPPPKAFSVKTQEQSKSVLDRTTSNTTVQPPAMFDVDGETNDDLLEGIVVKPTPCKGPDRILKSKCFSPENLLRTPYLKVSPPKSCVLLEPVPEFQQKVSLGVHRSTPFPLGLQNSEGSQDSESSTCQSSEKMSLKCSELPGIKLGNNYDNRRMVVEESPYRFMSPPKTCVLMEPPDDKLLTNALSDHPLPEVGYTHDRGASLFPVKQNDLQGDHSLANKTCKQELGSSFKMFQRTPMLKEPESTIRFGKRPGENTLKKELWTKFEAASVDGIHFNVSILQPSGHKGFLDRLDEAIPYKVYEIFVRTSKAFNILITYICFSVGEGHERTRKLSFFFAGIGNFLTANLTNEFPFSVCRVNYKSRTNLNIHPQPRNRQSKTLGVKPSSLRPVATKPPQPNREATTPLSILMANPAELPVWLWMQLLLFLRISFSCQ
ncbi:hypothetical protein ACH5RR_024455 [Cinchona calisaya]|uniref:Uncharacterized protein n=1 Tax=Cinchona calisaya TaxID=153742 RepID=A0ABD2YWT0_9GENT